VKHKETKYIESSNGEMKIHLKHLILNIENEDKFTEKVDGGEIINILPKTHVMVQITTTHVMNRRTTRPA